MPHKWACVVFGLRGQSGMKSHLTLACPRKKFRLAGGVFYAVNGSLKGEADGKKIERQKERK